MVEQVDIDFNVVNNSIQKIYRGWSGNSFSLRIGRQKFNTYTVKSVHTK